MNAFRRKLVLACACAAAAGATATEFFASPDAVDDGTRDCLTEATAGTFTNAMARATADGDIVTLLPGTDGIYDFTAFTPYANTRIVNVSSKSYFVGNKAITVRSQAGNPATVLLVGGGTNVNGRAFCFGAAATITGLTLSNFYTSGSAAAVYSARRDLVVSNCAILGNRADSNYGAVYRLKAVDCVFNGNFSRKNAGVGASLDLVRCNLVRNGAAGDAYASTGASVQNSTADGCTFQTSYMTTYFGSGLMISGSTLTNCMFRNSRAANYVQCSNCTFHDCLFHDNYVNNNGGGLVYKSTLYRCAFSNNYGDCANGLCVNGSTCHDCTFYGNVCSNTTYYCGGTGYGGRYYNCHFERNRTVNYFPRAGALRMPAYASNCVFIANAAGQGGAVSAGQYSLPAMTNCWVVDSFFTNNHAYGGGSGGSLFGVTVSNCVVYGSYVVANGGYGGAGYQIRAYDTLFENNESTNFWYAIAGGGALADSTAVNCVFKGNKDVGTSAAGACFNVEMTNCLVYGNETVGGSYGGSTVYSARPVVNCTIVSNTVPPDYAACVGNFVNCIIADNGPCDVWRRNELDTTLVNCIYGTVKGTTVTNIYNSVRVASTAAIKFDSTDIAAPNAYVPQYPSPARDAGLDVGLTAADRDLAGRKRVKGTGIDIGCYECIGSGGLILQLR